MSLFRTARMLGGCPLVGRVVTQNFCSTLGSIVVSPPPQLPWQLPTAGGSGGSTAQSFQTTTTNLLPQPTSSLNLWECLLADYQNQLRAASSSPSASAQMTVSGPGGQNLSGGNNLTTSSVDHSVRLFHQTATSEVKMEAQVIFDACWRRLEDKYGQILRVPREVVWLNGAPGSGKGVNTPHILKIRGLSRCVTVSSLLETSPEARTLMDRGEMVPEYMVGDALLDAVFNPETNDGVGLVVDGFPRTAMQVDFLKLLYDKCMALHNKNADKPYAERFPRPSFKVMVLYVDEETSIKRQKERAKLASVHNRRVLDAGAGSFRQERATDISEEKCRKRYEIFKAHYSAILRLKQFFPFHLIDSMGTLAETQASISQELRYQSSMDLDEDTYYAIRHVPLARDLVQTARQVLVRRLDDYSRRHKDLFDQTIHIIKTEIVPLLRRCGLAGHAEYVTKSPFFSLNPLTVDMIIDILADRGFNVDHVKEELVVPTRFDLKTGEITTRREELHRFRITFDVKGVREHYKAMEIAARVAESASDTRITQSFIPEGADHFDKYVKKSTAPGAPLMMDSSAAETAAALATAHHDNSSWERQFGYDDAEDIAVYYDPLTHKSLA